MTCPFVATGDDTTGVPGLRWSLLCRPTRERLLVRVGKRLDHAHQLALGPARACGLGQARNTRRQFRKKTSPASDRQKHCSWSRQRRDYRDRQKYLARHSARGKRPLRQHPSHRTDGEPVHVPQLETASISCFVHRTINIQNTFCVLTWNVESLFCIILIKWYFMEKYLHNTIFLGFYRNSGIFLKHQIFYNITGTSLRN